MALIWNESDVRFHTPSKDQIFIQAPKIPSTCSMEVVILVIDNHTVLFNNQRQLQEGPDFSCRTFPIQPEVAQQVVENCGAWARFGNYFTADSNQSSSAIFRGQ